MEERKAEHQHPLAKEHLSAKKTKRLRGTEGWTLLNENTVIKMSYFQKGISGNCSRRKGWLSTQSKKRSPGGEGMFTPSASAGQEGWMPDTSGRAGLRGSISGDPKPDRWQQD